MIYGDLRDNMRVNFKGTVYVLLGPSRGFGGFGMVADRDCMDEAGCLRPWVYEDLSFARIYSDGQVNRLGEQIGTVDDLVEVHAS